MAITRDDVRHVAALARLDLTEDEIARLELQLNDILEAVGKVSELDLSDVPPTSHPLDVVNVFRADEPRPSLPLDDVFANAPERDGDSSRVRPAGETAAGSTGCASPPRRQSGCSNAMRSRVQSCARPTEPRSMHTTRSCTASSRSSTTTRTTASRSRSRTSSRRKAF